MDSQKMIICRLCFKIQDDFDRFKAIEEDLKDVLDKVLQNLNLTAIQYPVICTNCTDTLMKCFGFKEKCIKIHDYISSFIDKDTVKLDLIDVYTSNNESGAEVQGVCGLCMKHFSPVFVEFQENVTLKKMIDQCIPELDMNIIKKPVICLPCHGSLENYFGFVSGSLIVEEIIKNYCESQNIDGIGPMDLSRLLQSEIMDVAEDVGGSLTDFIKIENQLCEDIGNADEIGTNNGDALFKFEQLSCDDPENSEELKLKSEIFIDTDDLKFNSAIKIEEPFCEENRLKKENLSETEDQIRVLEKVDIKTDESDFNRFEDDILPGPKVSKGDPKRHLLIHKGPSSITTYKCESCLYQTKRKHHFKTHLLQHKDPSELIMYKCDFCSYQAKCKDRLIKHSRLHKDPSEVTMYKCNSCWFETKYKRNLESHMLMHRDPSQVTRYKCDLCSFQTIHKKSHRDHFLRHKNPPKKTMYQCHLCSHQTNGRTNLNRHLQKHKDPSEVTVYKCYSCLFETKHKTSLSSHLLKHKDPSEVTMYKCDSCLFQTKYKIGLKRHLLVHKDPLEVTMYKCDLCLFQTKHKISIKRHLLQHKDRSEVATYATSNKT